MNEYYTNLIKNQQEGFPLTLNPYPKQVQITVPLSFIEKVEKSIIEVNNITSQKTVNRYGFFVPFDQGKTPFSADNYPHYIVVNSYNKDCPTTIQQGYNNNDYLTAFVPLIGQKFILKHSCKSIPKVGDKVYIDEKTGLISNTKSAIIVKNAVFSNTEEDHLHKNECKELTLSDTSKGYVIEFILGA